MNGDDGFTVPDLFRALGFNPRKEDTWAVGDRLAAKFRKATGGWPPKENRKKTDGSGGSHCFAIYPASWRAEGEALVKAIARERTAADLFDGKYRRHRKV